PGVRESVGAAERPPSTGFLCKLLVVAALYEAITAVALIVLPGAACWLVARARRWPGWRAGGSRDLPSRAWPAAARAAGAAACGRRALPKRGMLAYNVPSRHPAAVDWRRRPACRLAAVARRGRARRHDGAARGGDVLESGYWPLRRLEPERRGLLTAPLECER